MRIVAGAHKGRAITAPKGDKTRPTTDRVRESVFNKLTHAQWGVELEGLRVMDLFAGSGALGLEAISRGASFALFVETDPAARGAIRTNVDALQLFGCTKLHRRSATDLGPKPANMGTGAHRSHLLAMARHPVINQALKKPTPNHGTQQAQVAVSPPLCLPIPHSPLYHHYCL